MSDELLSSEDGPIHRLTLNRPARRNALTPELAGEIARELDLIEERGAARVVVLAGAGGHFCAGLDLHWLRSLGPLPPLAVLQRGLSEFQSAILAIARCPIPVVAELRGTTAGFGLDLALICDMRVAGSAATFTSAFARMGLVPDGGSTYTLPRLLGLGQALRFLIAGETLTAPAACDLGLVDEVRDDTELEAAVTGIAQAIAASAASSVRTIKRLVRGDELGGLEQALSAEGAAQIQALQAEEFQRRLEAFVSR